MELRLLGDLEVVDDDRVIPVRGPKQRLILALLAVHRGEVVATEHLVDQLWSDRPPSNPHNALQAQVSSLRKALGEPVLITRGNGYALGLAADEVDLTQFERAATEGMRSLAAGDALAASQRLGEALAMWRGPALADFVYDDFAQPEIARLEALRLAAWEARLEADLELGRHADVLGDLEAQCRRHPLRERLWEHRLLALYRCGRQAEALRCYDEIRRHLVEELGLEPGPALQTLQRRILAQDPALEVPARDAGQRGPVRPPSTTTDGAAATVVSLPVSLSRFVGRAGDLTALHACLDRHRLVTVVGTGGAGKTRVAIELAAQRVHLHPGGVWLAELAPVTESASVASAVAAAVGAGERSSPEVVAGSAVDRLVHHLAGLRALVVVDNCEHVVDGAAHVLEQLLERLPLLTVLATSREPLGVPGEALHPLGALPTEEAVELFVDRAAAADRTFAVDGARQELLAEMCTRLDGLPLAIELAASRLRALPLEQVAARLDDRFRLLTSGARTAAPRQQTLRAVVDWSHGLLFDGERRLFRRLSVFPGGCRLEVAEAVLADEEVPSEDVLDLLTKLVDKSLVVLHRDHDGGARYRQLQTLREYGWEKLVAAGEVRELRSRMAAWYLDLARGATEGLRGRTGPSWRQLLDAELENLRAALDVHIDAGDADAAIGLATGIAWQWFLRGDWHEAIRWLGDALATAGSAEPAIAARGRAWHGYYLVHAEGARHIDVGGRALAALRAHGSRLDVCEAALLRASSLSRIGQQEAALAALQEARPLLEEEGHEWGLALHDLLLALARARLAHLDEAEDAARRSVARFEAIGERWVLLEPLGTIAAIAAVRGDQRAALTAYDEVIDATRRLDLPGYLPYWLIWRAVAAARAGDDEAAVAGFDEASHASSNPVNTAFALLGGARARARRGEPEGGAEAARRAEAVICTIGRADLIAAARAVGAACAFDAGARPEAATLADTVDLAAGAAGAIAAIVRALCAGDQEAARRHLQVWLATPAALVPGTTDALLAADRDHVASWLT